MATQTETATQTASTLTLDPPKALQVVEPQQAAGLVPLKEDRRASSRSGRRLRRRAGRARFQLARVRQEGRPADHMGRKEIAEAAGHSNRFLDRPVKAINSDTGIGTDLTELRRTVEELDPARGNLSRRAGCSASSVRQQDARLFHEVPVGADPHRQDPRRAGLGQGRALQDNAAIDTERAQMWKTMGKLEQMIHISKTLDAKLEEKANELDATEPAKAKAIRETACSTPASAPPTCSPRWR
jgi:hypothetical protein